MSAKIEVIEYAKKLLGTPGGLLTTIEQQEKALAQQAFRPSSCPNPECSKPVNQFEAAPDTYTLGSGSPDNSFTCPHCRAGLRFVVPYISDQGWHWALRTLPPREGAAIK